MTLVHGLARSQRSPAGPEGPGPWSGPDGVVGPAQPVVETAAAELVDLVTAPDDDVDVDVPVDVPTPP